jgi:hypothetical protein
MILAIFHLGDWISFVLVIFHPGGRIFLIYLAIFQHGDRICLMILAIFHLGDWISFVLVIFHPGVRISVVFLWTCHLGIGFV